MMVEVKCSSHVVANNRSLLYSYSRCPQVVRLMKMASSTGKGSLALVLILFERVFLLRNQNPTEELIAIIIISSLGFELLIVARVFRSWL